MGVNGVKNSFITVSLSKNGEDFPSIEDIDNIEKIDIVNLSEWADVEMIKKVYEMSQEFENTNEGFSAEIYNKLALKNH
eukprot:CAMPEP_0205826792 /NCGR_PEP_ID=MMETSP0206-20130828/29889_1 /ASSEMBLY_ACC=CAM_ASM_000279 /TAXON_ID=36767 /ORGANISM="Euplotes focardii, Strain TN1" /LENGTH=78 /DNA_ID=CAMNT_0053127049 /DNA_START=309 /DNA_END=545 /DNA_ORIENTATION=+